MNKQLYKMILAAGIFIGFPAFSQLTDTNSLDQHAEQSQGNYQPMNMNYAGFNSSLGMIQEAWLDPLQNLGEGQSKPAYSKYYWSPDLVLPIRIREGMITIVNFPEWELLEKVFVGDTQSFDGQIYGPNTLMLYPTKGAATVGVDTNVFVSGRSGNKYVFYVKSEGVNTERLTNAIIDIEVVGDNGGSPSSGSMGLLGGGAGSVGANHVNAAKYGNVGNKAIDATFTRRFQKEDWLKSIPLDPAKFRFDIEIYVPNPDDVVIAPERVWRDDIFTYIDLGEKALNMVQRPIVTLIVERVETPIGFRTKGPNNRLIIVEGVGDMVMRSGKRMVCLKLRRSDDEGTQYVSYADDDNDWDVAPAIPAGKKAKSSAAGVDDSIYKSRSSESNAPAGMTKLPNLVNDEDIGISADKSAQAGNIPSISAAKVNSDGVPEGMSLLLSSDNTKSGSSDIKNPYPSYKYGSAFKGQGAESLSIELGTDGDVKKLESLWKDLSTRYPSQLGAYEPFYSVDTPADGQGKELFHLRVGPIDSLDSGDAVCSQLGRSGVFCSVVRIQ